jgi:hypothetical protein
MELRQLKERHAGSLLVHGDDASSRGNASAMRPNIH